MINPIQECRDLLAKWDAGEIVWTIEMGGLGPGYDQCIHITVFEMLRYMIERPVNFGYCEIEKDCKWNEKYYWNAYKKALDKVLFAEGTPCKALGLSGAQHGAALSLATAYIAQGHKKALASVDQDRRTQASKSFPGSDREVSHG